MPRAACQAWVNGRLPGQLQRSITGAIAPAIVIERSRMIATIEVSPWLQASKRSASSANPSTTMSVAGLGMGSGGPAGPHSSGRRTKAVR